MIADIKPWKEELKGLATQVNCFRESYSNLPESVTTSVKWNEIEQLNFELERTLFYSALVVRRIFETHDYTLKEGPNRTELAARCLPDEVLSKNLRLLIKDSDPERRETVSYKNLASEIIHSAYLSWDETSEQFRGFWLASARNETQRVLLVKWDDYLTALRDIYESPKRKAN